VIIVKALTGTTAEELAAAFHKMASAFSNFRLSIDALVRDFGQFEEHWLAFLHSCGEAAVYDDPNIHDSFAWTGRHAP